MAFKKSGTPQKMEILSGVCNKCNKSAGITTLGGMLVCYGCKKQIEDEKNLTKESING